MKNLFFIVITLLTLSCTSCKKWQHKYPEDTERSKDTPFERLTNKWWVLKTTTVNGIDFTDSMSKLFGVYKMYCGQSLYQVSQNGNSIYFGNINTDNEQPFTSAWYFLNNSLELGIGPFNGNNTNIRNCFVPGYLGHNYILWKYSVLKLSNIDLKISITTKDNDTTIINHFTKQ